MNGRERLNAVLRKQAKGRLSWTTLVDNATVSLLPEELRGNGGIDFYKHLGCDIFLLSGWNTPFKFKSPEHRWPGNVEESRQQEGTTTTITWRTPKGILTRIREGSHPIKYPVDSIEALRIYREMWEGASFVAHDDTDVLAGLDRLIGENGVVTNTVRHDVCRAWGNVFVPTPPMAARWRGETIPLKKSR